MTNATGDDQIPATNSASIDWAALGRILLKAAVLFILANLAFAACRPIPSLARLSAYNWLVPGRNRLPYGERPAADYNLTLNSLEAMFASQSLARAKAADEFRVVIIGDSGTWGWLLGSDETLAAQLTQLGLRAPDGRRVIAYNVGYPVLSLAKDLLLLDVALAYEPDLIIWPLTLQSLARSRQLDHPLLQNNAAQMRDLIADFDLDLDPADARFVDRTFVEETIVGRRRELADLVRLQGYGLAWAATGADQAIPEEITLRSNDFDEDLSWLEIAAPRDLTTADLALEIIQAGVERAGPVPVLVINEPIYRANGLNSDLRYNAFYPRWAFDQYRALLSDLAAAEGWRYVDLWDAIAPERFTDTPVHLDAPGTRQYAELLAESLFAAP